MAVASYEDYRVCRLSRVIFVNHGVGQTYTGKAEGMGSYSGGRNRDRTVLFLCPSERDADINRTAYPDIPSVAVGVPYLDTIQRNPDGPVVISFHANIHACPESRWAWPHYKDAIRELSRDMHIVGHCHPRARRDLEPWWKSIGVEYEPDWWKVLAMASVYCIDNSSSGYEAAAIGIPTVFMNAPWYRRDVHHGLRFWDAIPGYQVDDPSDLQTAIKRSLESPFDAGPALATAYTGLVDGHATTRAVEAICRIADS